MVKDVWYEAVSTDFPKLRFIVMRVSDIEVLHDEWYYDRPFLSYEVVIHGDEHRIASFVGDNWHLRKLSLLELELL